MDRCFYCKGTMENSYTSYMADLDGHYVIIKNVPCHKCKQCGEVSYSGETVARIEEIIEDYPHDYPFPSCLIFGCTVKNRVLHIVVGIGDSKLWLITAYEPDKEEWSKDCRTRRER